MIVCKTKSDLRRHLETLGTNPFIGFVPTMGALHKGHLSLVRQAKRENEISVVSIFVNPIQFDNADDLVKYPRNIDDDLPLLERVHCDVVFIPNEQEIYPTPPTETYDFGELEEVMEGQYRKGHFNGVATVVKRLFDIVKPSTAYFGEKDFQQLTIIRKLVENEHLPVEIVACPIVRESDGLAMSSRNVRLSVEDRRIAPQIHKILRDARDLVGIFEPDKLKGFVIDQLKHIPRTKLDYFEIVDSKTLRPIQQWQASSRSIGCVAIYLSDVRLIDNVKF
ncbi:pantothenate synthetase [Bacteroidia bacterium]|nr:pantothenate synthetase [Bacteroidia bacterium]